MLQTINRFLKTNFALRAISSIFICSVFLISIIWAHALYYTIIVVVLVYGIKEWGEIQNYDTQHMLVGLLLIFIPCLCLVYLMYQSGTNFVLLYFLTIWGVDTCAYIAGNIIGGPKLCPTISPKKTYSGFVVGILMASIIANMGHKILLIDDMIINIHFLSFGLAIGVLAQLSDLLMSFFKRKFGIKDFGVVIPGHGGILDRFDSFILSAPALSLFINYNFIT